MYSNTTIHDGETIEQAPVVVLPDPQWQVLDATELRDYHYAWGPQAAAIVLGFGSLYNHSFNYDGEPEDHTPLWFEPYEDTCVESIPLTTY